MTSPNRDYDDIVRRALHAIVDPIEPSGDGLARIRERAAQPWLRRQVSLLRAECVDLGWLIVTRCEPAVARARSGLATGGRAAGKRLSALYSYVVALVAGVLAALSRRWRAGGHRKSSAREEETGPGAHQGWVRRAWEWLATPTPWARPALVIAGVTVVVAALALGMPGVRGSLISLMNGGSGTSSSSGGGGGSPGAAGGQFHNSAGPGVAGPSGRGSESPGGPGYKGTSGSGRGSPASTCSPSPGAQPSPSLSASPSSSPTGSSSPTTSPASGTPVPAGSVSAVKAIRLRSGGKGGGGGGSASAAASATVGSPCSSSPSPQPNPSGTGSASPSASPTPPTGITTPPTPSTPPPGTGSPSP